MAAPVRCSTCGLQLTSYIEVIVDLAIERHREAAAFAAHGLAAGLRKVENEEPAMAEGNARRSVGPEARCIRPGRGEPVCHASDDGGNLAFLAPAGPEQARYAAHRRSPSKAGESDPGRFSCISRLSPDPGAIYPSRPFPPCILLFSDNACKSSPARNS